MSKLRVLVVEDSLTIRRYICDVLAADADVEVAGEAEDGKTAIELCARLRPDVIALDMVLPVMSGQAVTEYVMAHFPTPILIVSASTNRGELFKTYEALAAGAVDVLEKPTGGQADDVWEQHFLSTLKLVARIKVITHPRARLRGLTESPRASFARSIPGNDARRRVIALGASTGGPGAVVDVLKALRPSRSVAVLLVMHIDEPFSTAFADWLDGQTQHRVNYARDGETLEDCGGRVVMAPAGRHLIVRDGRMRLMLDPPRHSCRPSVDVLFESLAAEVGPKVVACLLTGMGRDGASGLLMLRRAGALTIAQDEATCVVYGMPREAVLLGAAERVLPLGEIGSALNLIVKPREGERHG
ncbi:MAG TPA: chemotaxis-specific protein-glutamate methyltransferase CheB [Polyangiaceae bacterium]|nr:chemotaxis-specific protein-glutamate methyltransferase CheB [Polyangiaceae bacterium]